MLAPNPAGVRLWRLWWLQPGLTRGNGVALLFASFTTIGCAAFMTAIQPYLLTEVLQVPDDMRGRITGALGMMQEVLIIALAAFVGGWSDRVGRRFVYITGFLLMATGYVVFPLATGIPELFALRLPFALGVALAPVMLSAFVADTPQEVSRGKWVGFNNLCQGLGVVFMSVVLAKTPAWFEALGFEPAAVVRLSYGVAAAYCLLAAAVLRMGLAPLKSAKPPASGLGRRVLDAIRAGRSNPRLLVAYGAAFIGRGDFTVVGVFFWIWVTQFGTQHGLSVGQALARGGMYFGLIQVSAMLWAPIMGLIVDRTHRLVGLGIALAIAVAGYGLIGQMDDPFARYMIPVYILLGIGEVSVIVGSGALLGQEIPAGNRGAVIGCFNAVGGIGILFAQGAGGVVFDKIGPTAPFSMMALLNFALLIAAVSVYIRNPGTVTLARVGNARQT